MSREQILRAMERVHQLGLSFPEWQCRMQALDAMLRRMDRQASR